MRLGIAISELDPWDFFHEIYADLSENHQTYLFKRRQIRAPFFYERINRDIFRRDLQAFMQTSDVVFFEWASQLLAYATKLPKVCGMVTRLHRYEMYQWVDQVNWDAVDRVILVSKAKQKEFSARFPDQAKNTVVIPEAVSLDKFTPNNKSFKGDIGIMCHLTPRKRVYDLLMTFYELTKRGDEFHLHIAGGPKPAFYDHYYSLLYVVAELGIQDRVTFYGNVKDTNSWYKTIDIYISNSYSEGLQVAPMEAMATGCYCLSHHWAGADELLPEEHLYYSSQELIDKILSYAELPGREKLRQKDRMRSIVVENFNIEKTKLQIRQIVEEAGAISISR